MKTVLIHGEYFYAIIFALIFIWVCSTLAMSKSNSLVQTMQVSKKKQVKTFHDCQNELRPEIPAKSDYSTARSFDATNIGNEQLL